MPELPLVGLRMAVLVDRPVRPYSAPDDIRAWIQELEERRTDLGEDLDPPALRSYEQALRTARAWLADRLAKEEGSS